MTDLQSIAAAVALLPSTKLFGLGGGTDVLAALNAIVGMAANGVTLAITSSANANVDAAGVITFTSAYVSGNVVIAVTKGAAAPGTKTIAVIVAGSTSSSVRVQMPDRVTGDWMHAYIGTLSVEVQNRFTDLQVRCGITIPNDGTIMRSAQMEIFMSSF